MHRCPSRARRDGRACGVLVILCLLHGLATTAPGALLKKEELVAARLGHKTDKLGMRWDVQPYGTISDGTSDCFDTGLQLKVNGQDFRGSRPQMTKDGSEFVLSQALGQLSVVRRVFVDLERGGARYIELVTNKGSKRENVALTVRSYLGGSCSMVVTSEGKPFTGTLGKKGCGLVAIHMSGSRPNVMFLLAAPRSKVPTTVMVNSQREILVTYNLTCKPGSTCAIVHWVGQRRGTSPTTAADLFTPFFKRGRLQDARIPRHLRRCVLNFRTGVLSSDELMADLLEPMALVLDERGIDAETQDVLWFGEENQIVGKVSCESLTARTAFGQTEVSAEELGLLLGGMGAGRPMKLYLRTGEVLTGDMQAGGLRLADTNRNAVIDLDPARIDTLAFRTGGRGATLEPGVYAFFGTHAGDHLLLTGRQTASLRVVTAWGPLDIPIARLRGLAFTREPFPSYRVTLTDGSRFSALLPAQSLSLNTRRFGPVELGSGSIRAMVRFERGGSKEVEPEETDTEEPEFGELSVPHAVLTGENVFAGRLEGGALHVATPVGLREVPADDVHVMERIEEEGPMALFWIATHGGEKIRGPISEQMLTFAGDVQRLRIPAEHVRGIYRPMAPEDGGGETGPTETGAAGTGGGEEEGTDAATVGEAASEKPAAVIEAERPAAPQGN